MLQRPCNMFSAQEKKIIITYKCTTYNMSNRVILKRSQTGVYWRSDFELNVSNVISAEKKV